MVGIVTDDTRRKILENDREKLQEELREKQKELGLQGMVGLKNQNEMEQIIDLDLNASKIKDTMEERNAQRAIENRKRREAERAKRYKEAPEKYFKMKREKERMEFERRRISI